MSAIPAAAGMNIAAAAMASQTFFFMIYLKPRFRGGVVTLRSKGMSGQRNMPRTCDYPPPNLNHPALAMIIVQLVLATILDHPALAAKLIRHLIIAHSA